jgi:ABC-type antimicrobial peptide transport system permease subunit
MSTATGGMRALDDARQSFADHLVIIKSALIFAALLVVLVGGLGMTTTLTLNVIERTREIGILSAIGATPRTIARGIAAEGLVMVVLSWCVAVIAAPRGTNGHQGGTRVSRRWISILVVVLLVLVLIFCGHALWNARCCGCMGCMREGTGSRADGEGRS